MRVHSVSREWSAVKHMMIGASHVVCETNANYGDPKGGEYGRRTALAASPSSWGTSTQECEGASQWVGERDLQQQQQQRQQRSHALYNSL